MKEKILLAIAQFEDIYSEWDDYLIKSVGDDLISVYDRNDNEPYDIPEAAELLTDFKGVLKKNNLMISSYTTSTAKIEMYIYSFEAQYEEIADQIERTLANKITNLYITQGEDGRPKVEYEFATNLTSGQKAQVDKTIQKITNQI